MNLGQNCIKSWNVFLILTIPWSGGVSFQTVPDY